MSTDQAEHICSNPLDTLKLDQDNQVIVVDYQFVMNRHWGSEDGMDCTFIVKPRDEENDGVFAVIQTANLKIKGTQCDDFITV